MRPTQVLALLAVFATALYTLFIASHQSDSTLLIASNLTVLIASFCAFATTAIAWKRVPKKFQEERRGWFLTSLAFLCFFLGDALWAYSELLLGVAVPVGSWPDALWTLAYLFWIGGCITISNLIFDPTQRKKIIITMCILLSAVWTFLQIKNLPTEGIIVFINQLFVTYDIILLGLIIPLILILRSNSIIASPWMLFAASVCSRVIFDVIYAALIAHNAYGTGSPIDILYLLSYTLAAFAADSKRSKLP